MRRFTPWMLPVACVALALLAPAVARAQAASDTLAQVRVRVRADSAPAVGAIVRGGGAVVTTGADGSAVVMLPAGAWPVVIQRLGFLPHTVYVVARPGQQMTITVDLVRVPAHIDDVVVTSTRTGRRVDDEPTRVEVLGRDEVEEKLLMTPGDIAMMLNETSGLRVQTTSPSLGGASVRVQGLRGRYTQLLSDGLPLYGGQAGGLGLLQIPPVDLRQVEVIKGAASALYGSSALGGVINLVSRRPSESHEREILLNQTTRQGSDGVLWLSGPLGKSWGYTTLAGAHRQSQTDIDGDGWTDLAGYARAVVRPRLFWDAGNGRSLFATTGLTVETRNGGTMPGRTAPDGAPFDESLETRRGDVGVVGRFASANGTLAGVRASAMEQRHEHHFGSTIENDRHRTWFTEATLTIPRHGATWLIGAAFQRDEYHAEDVQGFNYAYSVPSVFVQGDFDPAPWLGVTASARLDAHSTYGTVVNPRISALAHVAHGWTARASVATGTFAPTPFTEETEVIGLAHVTPLSGLVAEQATTASVDVGGPVGAFEINGTLFGSSVRHPLAAARVTDIDKIAIVNGGEATRTHGAETFVRWRAAPLTVTASYTYTRATELDVEASRRRDVALTPSHAVGIVGMWEREDVGRAGFEWYFTGRQSLDDNPYRSNSRPYVIVGFLAERNIKGVRVFVNAENLTGVRQTRYDPLVRPVAGRGGRWTTDAWTELSGRTINGGVRWAF